MYTYTNAGKYIVYVYIYTYISRAMKYILCKGL